MKRIVVLSLTVLLLCSSCAKKNEKIYVHMAFSSEITAGDCYLCSDNPESNIADYVGQDNIGVIDVNSFEVLPIELNRYENGVLITEKTGVFRNGGGTLAGEQVSIMTDVDRGYALVTFNADTSSVDAAEVVKYMCQECLDDFASKYFISDNPPPIALIDFVNREIKPLVNNNPWFGLGNYLIDCDFENNGDVGLFVVYRPVRYGDTESVS